MKKVLARIGTLLLVMAMTLAIIPGAAFASDNNKVVLTKLTNKTTEDQDTDGQEITDTTSYGSALANVTFTLYKTNVAYKDYAGIGTGTNQVPTPGAALDTAIPGSWTVAKTSTTDANGQITWEGLADGIYYLVETGAPATVKTKSVSAYIMLPYTYTQGDNAGTTTNTVYVYPKNDMEVAELDVTKVSAGNTTDAKINKTSEVAANGETVHFTSTFPLDSTFTEVDKFDITDTQVDGLGKPSNVTLTMTGGTGSPVTIAAADYILTASGNDFTINFTSFTNAVAAYAAGNTKLVLDYDSVFSYSTVMASTAATGESSVGLKNTVNASYRTTNPDQADINVSDIAYIATGSATITKTVPADKTAAGIVFKLQKKNTNNVFEDYIAPGTTAVMTATVGTDGKAVFTGLGDGEYQAVETKTNAGLSLNPNPVTFTITDVFDTTPTASTNVLNATGTIANYTQPVLPLTGGTGIAMIAIIGAALIGGAFILMKKRNVSK